MSTNNNMNYLTNNMARLSIGENAARTSQRNIPQAYFRHRVSETLSLADLKHEYGFRYHGDMYGTSKKSKAWFVKKLGMNSICECAYAAGIAHDLPRVDDRSTIPMLKRELNARQPGLATSGFNKPWFLEQLGVGSVMMTEPGVTQHIWAATQPGPPPV